MLIVVIVAVAVIINLLVLWLSSLNILTFADKIKPKSETNVKPTSTGTKSKPTPLLTKPRTGVKPKSSTTKPSISKTSVKPNSNTPKPSSTNTRLSTSTVFIGKNPPPASKRDPLSIYVKNPVTGLVSSQPVSLSNVQYQGASVPVLTTGGASVVMVNGKPVYGSVKNGIFIPGGQGNPALQELLSGKGGGVAAVGTQASKNIVDFVTGPQAVSVQGQAHTVKNGKGATMNGKQVSTIIIDGKIYANDGGKIYEGTLSGGVFKPTGQVNNKGQIVDSKGRVVRGAGSQFLGDMVASAATGGAIGASMGGPIGAVIGAGVGLAGGALANFLTGKGGAPSTTSGTKPLPTQPTIIKDAKGDTFVFDPKKNAMSPCTMSGNQRSDEASFRYQPSGGGGGACPTTLNIANVYDLNAVANARLQALNPQFAPLPPPSSSSSSHNQAGLVAAAAAAAMEDHPALSRLPPSRSVAQQLAERQAALAAQERAERQSQLTLVQQNALVTALTRGYTAQQYMASGNAPRGFTARDYNRLLQEHDNAGTIYNALIPHVSTIRDDLQTAKTVFDVANTQYRNALNLVRQYGNNVPQELQAQTRTLYNQAANAWLQVTHTQNVFDYNMGYMQHLSTLATLGHNENIQHDWNQYTLSMYGAVTPTNPSTLTAPPTYQSRVQYTAPPPLPVSIPQVYPEQPPPQYDDLERR